MVDLKRKILRTMHCRSKALAENNLAIKIFFLSILLKAKKEWITSQLEHPADKWFFGEKGKHSAIEIKLMKVNSYLACRIFPWEPHYWIIQLKPLQFFIFHGKLPKQLAPCAVTMAWISAGWELCLSLCLHLCLCLSLWLSLHLSVFSLVFVCVTVAWISARWERAPRENWSCLHSLREREGCCNFSTAASFLLFKSSECRPMMGFACICTPGCDHGPEYKWIFTDPATYNANLQINLKFYSTNFHTSLTSTLYIFSQFWLSTNFLVRSPRLKMQICEFSSQISQTVCKYQTWRFWLGKKRKQGVGAF